MQWEGGQRLQKQWGMRGLWKESHHKKYYNKGKHRGWCSLTVWMQTYITFKKRVCASLQGALHEIGLCANIAMDLFVSACNALVLIKKQGKSASHKKGDFTCDWEWRAFSSFRFSYPFALLRAFLLFCVVEVDSIPPQRESTQCAWRTRSFALSWSNSHNKYTGTRQRKGGD